MHTECLLQDMIFPIKLTNSERFIFAGILKERLGKKNV